MGKKILGGVAVLLIAVIVAVYAVLASMDFNQYKPMIIEEAHKATGRTLKIDGPLDLAISLSPALVTEGVSLSNADWGSKPDMISVKRVEVELSLLPLLTGGIQVNRLVVLDPVVLIETNKDGKSNLEMTPVDAAPAAGEAPAADAGGEGGGGLPAIDVSSVLIRGADLTVKDAKAGSTMNLKVDELTAEDTGSAIALALAGSYNDNPFAVEGAVGALSDLLGNDDFAIKLAAEAGGVNVGLDGSIAKPMDGKGLNVGVTVKAETLAGLSGLAGSPVPGIGPVDLSTTVTEDSGTIALSDISAKIGGSDLAGKVTANTAGAKPVVTASLTSNLLRLDDLTGGGAKDGAAEPAPAATTDATSDGKPKKVFPADPLPLDGLRGVDADATVVVKMLEAAGMKVQDLNVTVSLKNGLLKVQPLGAMLSGGKINGGVTLDASKGKSAGLNVDLSVAQLPLGSLLKDMDLSSDLTGGMTDVTVKLKGAGPSVAGIMGSSNGQLLVVVGKGELNGRALDLAGGDALMNVLGSLNPTKSDTTALQCAVVNFKIKDGTAVADKGIAVETGQMMVVGDGDIDLKTEEIDLAVRPEAREGLNLGAGQLTKPFKLAGTLAEPGLGLDVVGAASTALKVGKAISTGGLSLLADAVVDKVLQDSNPCLTAQGKEAPKKSSSSTSSGGSTAPAEEKKSNNPVDALKGLFGN